MLFASISKSFAAPFAASLSCSSCRILSVSNSRSRCFTLSSLFSDTSSCFRFFISSMPFVTSSPLLLISPSFFLNASSLLWSCPAFSSQSFPSLANASMARRHLSALASTFSSAVFGAFSRSIHSSCARLCSPSWRRRRLSSVACCWLSCRARNRSTALLFAIP